MTRNSLPHALQIALKHHASAADIREDDELKTLLTKLSDLDEKLNAIKAQVKVNREKKKQS